MVNFNEAIPPREAPCLDKTFIIILSWSFLVLISRGNFICVFSSFFVVSFPYEWMKDMTDRRKITEINKTSLFLSQISWDKSATSEWERNSIIPFHLIHFPFNFHNFHNIQRECQLHWMKFRRSQMMLRSDENNLYIF